MIVTGLAKHYYKPNASPEIPLDIGPDPLILYPWFKKMALSYSGIVNYGKVTLPSVDSWGTNMNILKDPPKSVHTRKIDRVGETSAITSAVDDSGDRFSEAINYYARGQNPMVAVSYGQGQKRSSNSSGGEAFLPYRIARDGAFRPPIWRQEDLLPLSRLPRIWTEVSTQPYNPIFTKRIRDCGTAEDTREVKNHALQVACSVNKTVAAYPNINQPDMKPGIVRDPLAPGQVDAPRSCGANASEIVRRMAQRPILLAPSRPITSGATNPTSIKETPIIMNNIRLSQNHPTASAVTNFAAPSLSGYNPQSETQYTRLPPRSRRGGFDGYQGIPSVDMNHPTKNLIKVR
jgi:hypothetical protein